MSDFGIKVSVEGVDVSTATGKDLLLNMQYPHTKIDTTNDNSFQNILLTFNNDPPDAPANGSTDTEVHSFEHGYDYLMAYWALVQVVTPPASVIFYQDFFQQEGSIGQLTAFDNARFYVKADDSKIYFHVEKSKNSGLGGMDVDPTDRDWETNLDKK